MIPFSHLKTSTFTAKARNKPGSPPSQQHTHTILVALQFK